MSTSVDPADQFYAVQWGGPVVVVKRQWVVILALIATNVGTAYGYVQVSKQLATMTPIVVKEHADGRLESMRYDMATDGPSMQSVRFYLQMFTEKHWRRFRHDIQREYPSTRVFLAPEVWKQQQDSDKDGKDVISFAGDLQRDDVDVRFKKMVRVEEQYDQNRRLLGGVAQLHFDRETLDRSNRDVKATESLIATVHYTLPESAPNDIVESNPIGLQITELRVD